MKQAFHPYLPGREYVPDGSQALCFTFHGCGSAQPASCTPG